MREGVEKIKAVAVRAAEIVRELMAYAGQENPVFEPVDLSLGGQQPKLFLRKPYRFGELIALLEDLSRQIRAGVDG